jgi:gas vesicle protein
MARNGCEADKKLMPAQLCDAKLRKRGYTMNKVFGFLAGAMCGAVVGAAASLFFTPTSGSDLRAQAASRWEMALSEARSEMERTQRELQTQFEQMRTA